ncbi:11670_t:CDS:2 [Funneliformis geosporum]|nr:11670_t:CDS:2 [Funneliformis geosporum]
MTLKEKLALLKTEFTNLKTKITTKLTHKEQVITEKNTKLQESNRKVEEISKENSENEKVLEQLLKEFKETTRTNPNPQGTGFGNGGGGSSTTTDPSTSYSNYSPNSNNNQDQKPFTEKYLKEILLGGAPNKPKVEELIPKITEAVDVRLKEMTEQLKQINYKLTSQCELYTSAFNTQISRISTGLLEIEIETKIQEALSLIENYEKQLVNEKSKLQPFIQQLAQIKENMNTKNNQNNALEGEINPK